MEGLHTWMHYLDDVKIKEFVVCVARSTGDFDTLRILLPYESTHIVATAQINYDVYISGGGAAHLQPEQFYPVLMRVRINPDLTTGADKLASMPIPRTLHTMVALTNNLLYVAGGINATGFLASTFEYNIASNSWKEVAALNERKSHLTLCPFQGQTIYAFGGLLEPSKPPSSLIECLSATKLSAKTWAVVSLKAGSELWRPIVQMGAFALTDSCILIFGGILNSTASQLCFTLNPTTGTLQKHNQLSEADTFAGSQACLFAGHMYIAGSMHRDLHIYDIHTHTWNHKPKTMWYPTALDFKSDTF